MNPLVGVQYSDVTGRMDSALVVDKNVMDPQTATAC